MWRTSTFETAPVGLNVDPAVLDKLRSRIQGLRAKTVDNGCTEDEALAAAVKMAELLDRYDLSLSDVDLRASACERVVYRTNRKKRIPISDCVGAIAQFCDCRVWREKGDDGETCFVFFGLPADTAAALYLTDLVDAAVRTELGRYKTSSAYLKVGHRDRHLVNGSFAFGMVVSIGNKLVALKATRDRTNARTGRDLLVIKTTVVDAELDRLGVRLRTRRSGDRLVSPDAFEAGDAAGAGFAVIRGVGTDGARS